MSWDVTFGIILDMLWRARNELVFEMVGNSPVIICDRITKMIQDVQAAAADSSVDSLVLRARGPGVIKWLHPMEEWVKINTDGSFSSLSNKAACWGGYKRP